jgi:hypothetical protein
MAQDLNTLIELAEKYGTDKAGHGYLPYYATHLPKKCTRLLEIGAFKGASLRMWKDLYPDAEIVCFDLFQDPDNISKMDVEKMGIKAYQGDQGYERDLGQIEGEFDVIIEDGSHRSDHQIITLNALWPKVKLYEDTLLGMMTIPDWRFQLAGASHWELYGDKIAFIFKQA